MGPSLPTAPPLAMQIAEANDPRAETDRLIKQYEEQFAHPYIAASKGYVDDVIDPRETRPRLIASLRVIHNKREPGPPRKHGNIPL